VLTYHRIGPKERAGELDPALFEATTEQLEAQLEVISSQCTPVSLADLRRFAMGARLPPNPVLVTFDDGYLEGHDVALPLLRRAGVPATFFIPTAFPDAGRLFWWDRVHLLMRRAAAPRVDLDYPRRLTLHPQSAPAEAARLVCQAIKQTAGIDLPRLWETLEERAGVVLSAAEERALAARSIMGFAEVRALAAAGLDVQSHSHEHLVLNTLSPEAARRDLSRSAEVLRDALGAEVYGVAYPVGYELRGPVRRAPEEAGFELGFTNDTGVCPSGPLDPLQIPRLSMDLDYEIPDYKSRLLFGCTARDALQS
jgi:peptidoglycan/xylan/chitin deacetylase (PgdA/CDA1 family)